MNRALRLCTKRIISHWHQLQLLPRTDGEYTMERRRLIRDDPLQIANVAYRRLATSSS